MIQAMPTSPVSYSMLLIFTPMLHLTSFQLQFYVVLRSTQSIPHAQYPKNFCKQVKSQVLLLQLDL